MRVRIAAADGREAWGAAAELLAPKWFDKNRRCRNEDNFDQLRASLRAGARGLPVATRRRAARSATSRAMHERHLRGCAARGLATPLVASFGTALLDRAIIDALLRGAKDVSFYAAMRANRSASTPAPRPTSRGFDIDAFLASAAARAAHRTRATPSAWSTPITAADLSASASTTACRKRCEEVVAAYGHRYFKLKVGGKVDADVERLQRIAGGARPLAAPYHATLDGNEQYARRRRGDRAVAAHPRARRRCAGCATSILFIEQPIARKPALARHIGALAALGKPVIIDESDARHRQLRAGACAAATRGVSSKSCKGFYRALLNARALRGLERAGRCARYFMSAEDLTTQAGCRVQQDLALVTCSAARTSSATATTMSTAWRRCRAPNSRPSWPRTPTCTTMTAARCASPSAPGRCTSASLDTPGLGSAVLPDTGSMTEKHYRTSAIAS